MFGSIIKIILLFHLMESTFQGMLNKPIFEKIGTMIDGTKVKHLSFNEGTNLSLICRIPPGKYFVVWERQENLDNFPLVVGNEIFVKDPRIKVHHTYPDKWILKIDNVKTKDSGIYSCSTTDGIRGPTPGFENEKSDGIELPHVKPSKISYNITIVNNGQEKSSAQVNDDASNFEKFSSKIKISSPKVAIYGSRVEIKCHVTSDGQKPSIQNQIEWYQNGYRVKSSLNRSVFTKRLDSNAYESTLTIDRIFPQDSGSWICLQRGEEKYNGIINVVAFEKVFLEVVDLPGENVPISQMSKLYQKSISPRHTSQNEASRNTFSLLLFLLMFHFWMKILNFTQ